MKRQVTVPLALLWMVVLAGPACNRKPGGSSGDRNQTADSGMTSIRVELENHTGSSGEIETVTLESGDQIVSIQADSWLAYEVPVAVPGRYKAELHLLSGSEKGVSCWIEDYVDNKDDRTYNITGSMEVPHSESPGTLVTVSRDGSPLNQGVHRMKLHVVGGEAGVDWISFTLLKPHRESRQVLTQRTDGKEWVVVWSDEFEEGGVPDTAKWTYDIGNWGWGNNELQYYTENRRENARIENGTLIIEARKNDMQQQWTSARLTTRGKTSFLYGRIEFRARVPVERGNWAAGWTLGNTYVDELSWPYCGEIDIMESVGFEIDDQTGDGLAHASVHCGAYYFKLMNQPTATTPVRNMNQEYHLYAIEWSPRFIKAFVDDVHYFTYDDTTDALTWPFDIPQDIILNLAMGGGWGGAQGMDENVTLQQLVIDYVRVYERR